MPVRFTNMSVIKITKPTPKYKWKLCKLVLSPIQNVSIQLKRKISLSFNKQTNKKRQNKKIPFWHLQHTHIRKIKQVELHVGFLIYQETIQAELAANAY